MSVNINFNKAICLIEAVDDLRFPVIQYLVEKKEFNPNVKNQRGLSVVHYLCGIENIQFAERTLTYLFNHGANVNEPTLHERFTPLHIAAMNDRVSLAKILIKQGADKKCLDADGNPPIFYAINNGCWTMVEVVRNYILHEKAKARKQNARDLLQSAQLNSLGSSSNGCGNLLNTNLMVADPNAASDALTPTRITYNFDKASPYYVNITHRRKCSTPCLVGRPTLLPQEIATTQNVNIFELTEENLAQFSKSIRESGRFEMFQQWQEKVKDHKKRESILSSIILECDQLLGDDKQHVDGLMTEDELPFYPALDRTSLLEPPPDHEHVDGLVTEDEAHFNPAMNKASLLRPPIRESDFIQSPTKGDVVMQMTECYVHTDDEQNIVFYEKKLLPVEQMGCQESDKRTTTSAASSVFKLNTDYDTDLLRQELTQFGDIPGPITKSTKKLYLKRLVKYQRDPKTAEHAAAVRANSNPVYSLELQKTFDVVHAGAEVFIEFLTLEEQMVSHFQQKVVKKMREGNKKMSFIYLLMDPRELDNLAANHSFISKKQAWQQFIKAIFYVGKGKKSRPYAHLYEAIRQYDQNKENVQVFNRHPQALDSPKCLRDRPKVRAITGNQFTEPEVRESKKLKRILDIWTTGQGVVSMNLFHNITPSEAYTREAAIIDAIGMNNLTNQVRGHYYGISESWTFKQRKQLGVGLLYKALQIHLIEGESQLTPNDI